MCEVPQPSCLGGAEASTFTSCFHTRPEATVATEGLGTIVGHGTVEEPAQEDGNHVWLESCATGGGVGARTRLQLNKSSGKCPSRGNWGQ